MLSKEEYKKALDNIKLNYDAEYVNECNDEFCQAMKGYVYVIENLINEHFNPQPYKFEDLKECDYVYDKKEKEIVLIIGTLENRMTNQKIIRALVFGYKDFIEIPFEENRFYPVQMANVRCE